MKGRVKYWLGYALVMVELFKFEVLASYGGHGHIWTMENEVVASVAGDGGGRW